MKKDTSETKEKKTKKTGKNTTKKKNDSTDLTPAQQKFVDGIFMGLSQRAAYKRAYNCEGWKDSLIDSKASKLASNGKVKARLKELNDAYQIRMQNKLNINKDWIMERLCEIASANIMDFLKIAEGNMLVGVDKETLKPIYVKENVVTIYPTAEVERTKYSAVACVKQGKHGIEIKCYDKIKALELLGKEMGMFKEHVEIEQNGTIEEYLKNAKRRSSGN